MANKTIKQALETLFLGLGGNPSALADNVDTSDVIDDLESAIKGLIPEAELPEVTADDNGKILAVVDGEWTKVTMTAVADTTTGAVTITLTPDETSGT
ncbi:hypothetical protein [Methanobrevibacter sp.]|uniref:hypothetical protein n=1 Tax=Methanobrevibacter sp. TaxID=66852 RepID=UPI00388F088D